MPTPRQRALVNDVSIEWHSNAIQISASRVYYLTDGQDYTPGSAGASRSSDATPRELTNALVDAIIASQPAGYDLSPKDVIVPSLERG